MRNNNIKKVLALALLFTASSAFAAATKPGAPRWVTATAGVVAGTNTSLATVTFSPPASNGGATITSYTVSCTPACTPVSGPASPIRVGDLVPGTPYTFTMTATNSAGTGIASAASNSAPKCEVSLVSSQSMYGFVKDDIFHYAQKLFGTNSGSCILANGCDGWVDFRLTQCSDGYGTGVYVTLNYGPAYDNTLINALYHAKNAGTRSQIVRKSSTDDTVIGIYEDR